ncbi:MAG: ribosome maturation factor RimP [Gammaproteobacteria bacterium]|nr:ribosome maturation factor RimP [Gammaproteobacteria bacterium]
MAKLERQLTELLEPAVSAVGFELLGVELVRAGRHSTVRLYIDSEAGVTVDDCALVSRQVGAVLDVEDPISTEYDLEVSSPGLDRPLFKPAHFARVVGEEIKVQTAMPIANRRRFKGPLLACHEHGIELEQDGAAVLIPFDNIDAANLVAKL